MSNPQGQRSKVIKKKNSVGPEEPVDITLVRTKKGVVEFGREFDDDDVDWIRGLRLTVKNKSIKNINYVKFHLYFERPKGDSSPPLLHSIVYGSKASPSKVPRILAPDRAVDLTLPGSSYDAIKRALSRLGYSAVANHVEIALAEVVFDDDSMWSNGYWFRRDPTDRQNWIPFDRAFTRSYHPVQNSGSPTIIVPNQRKE